MLVASVVANILLLVALAVTFIRAKQRIREEKLATFAGCLAAAASGLWHDDREERLDRMASSLSSIIGKKDEIEPLLARAALMRVLRDAVAGDVLGEHGRLLALQAVGQGRGVEDEVFSYMDVWEPGMPEPRDKFDDAGLARAQFKIEAELLYRYDLSIGSGPLKLIGN